MEVVFPVLMIMPKVFFGFGDADKTGKATPKPYCMPCYIYDSASYDYYIPLMVKWLNNLPAYTRKLCAYKKCKGNVVPCGG